MKYLLGFDLRILWLSPRLLQLLGVYAHAVVGWVLVAVDDSRPVEAVNDHLRQTTRLHRLAKRSAWWNRLIKRLVQASALDGKNEKKKEF